jgi:phosphate acetyltransferase
MSLPEAALEFMSRQIERAKQQRPKKRIVFPEGNDPRILAAAERLGKEGVVTPILIGRGHVDPDHSPDLKRYARIYHERRRSKGITESEANDIGRRPLFFAALMVAAGDADGFVGGAANTTAETVRAALHAVGPAPRVKTVSSVFLMAVQDRSFGHKGIIAFADCAVVVEPGPVELAEIAIATAQSTKILLDCEPVVALLSYSTKGSGKGKRIDKVVEALRIVKARAPDLHVDGELQSDAAIVPGIGRSKAPGSTVAGKANTLVFPDLMSANIAYKLVERLGHASAIGPFLQGLAKPANDLSRGCSAEDVYNVSVVTALQAQG